MGKYSAPGEASVERNTEAQAGGSTAWCALVRATGVWPTGERAAFRKEHETISPITDFHFFKKLVICGFTAFSQI